MMLHFSNISCLYLPCVSAQVGGAIEYTIRDMWHTIADGRITASLARERINAMNGCDSQGSEGYHSSSGKLLFSCLSHNGVGWSWTLVVLPTYLHRCLIVLFSRPQSENVDVVGGGWRWLRHSYRGQHE